MTLNFTLNKKNLETIIKETFTNFSFLVSSSLLDSLKLLGFYYATNGSISISLDDLKTPEIKKKYIKEAKKIKLKTNTLFSQGVITSKNRFEKILNAWDNAGVKLKDKIIEYYRNFDPVNNLYIMACSGARGNMSQVRQLLGMRGLMADQDGNLIALPIEKNFREGLNSIDYMISSYGARKGIVDTALKTASSGYLTRRLVYLAQDLIIRELDCKTNKGILIFFKKNSSIENLIGRQTQSIQNFSFLQKINSFSNRILTLENLSFFKKNSPLLLKIRSSLTCESKNSICQKCYGWDLSKKELISLGATVGVIAAQSIGEPGTQLTMRTFHTGGIFSNDSFNIKKAPFSGKLIISNSFFSNKIEYRNQNFNKVIQTKENYLAKIINYKGIEKKIIIPKNSYLHISKPVFIYKDELISEYYKSNLKLSFQTVEKVVNDFNGQIFINNYLKYFRKVKGKGLRRILLKENRIWIISTEIISLPLEAEFKILKSFKKNKAIANIKIITPINGIVILKNLNLEILNKNKKVTINLSNIYKDKFNSSYNISFLVQNYQYVDEHSLLAIIYIFPKVEGKLYSIKKKSSISNEFLILMEKNFYKLYGPFQQLTIIDELKNKKNYGALNFFNDNYKFNVFKNNLKYKNDFLSKKVITNKALADKIYKLSTSTTYFYQNKNFLQLRVAQSIYLSPNSILKFFQNDFIPKGTTFALSPSYGQSSDDIVQGLPKIEELLELRKPINLVEAYLSEFSGILLATSRKNEYSFSNSLKWNNFICEMNFIGNFYNNDYSNLIENSTEILTIGENLINKELSINYNNLLYTFKYVFIFDDFKFSKKNNCFLSNGKKFFIKNNLTENNIISKWNKTIIPISLLKTLIKFWNKKYISFDNKKISYTIYKRKNKFNNEDYFFQVAKNIFIYLENFQIITTSIILPFKTKIRVGEFIELGQPLTSGIINVYELLNLLFSYQKKFDNSINAYKKSLVKFNLILSNSLLALYEQQDINISSLHSEIIASQMTSKVKILFGGSTPFLPNEFISFAILFELFFIFKNNVEYIFPTFEPKIVSTTGSSIYKDSFLASAAFQETRKTLLKAAVLGTCDWLRNLKAATINSKIIPSGSAFLNYKNYLNNFYNLKNF